MCAQAAFTFILRRDKISKQEPDSKSCGMNRIPYHHTYLRRASAGSVTDRRPIMKEKFNSQDALDLYEAILSLESVEECEAFFEDLCTINELISMMQRFQVAKMLDTDMTYSDIAGETSASTTTISRVNRALNYGANGYRTVIDRMKDRKQG